MKINQMTKEEIILNLENEELINQIYDLIRSYCWENNCYSEDNVQDIILLVIKGLSTFDKNKAVFTTWLYKICLNKFAMDYRKQNSLKRKGEKNLLSLDLMINEEKGTYLYELIPENKESESERYKKDVSKLVYKSLSPITKKYFDGETQYNLSREYNLSQAQISRIISKEIKEIRKKLEVNI